MHVMAAAPSLHRTGLNTSWAELAVTQLSSELCGSSPRRVPTCIFVKRQHWLRGFTLNNPAALVYLMGGQGQKRQKDALISSEIQNTARKPAASEQAQYYHNKVQVQKKNRIQALHFEAGQLISGLQSAEIARSDLEESNRRSKTSFNIIFVAAEVAPYSKTGGLADVCGSLPIALAARGHRVMVISPRYMNGVSDAKFAGAFDAQCRIKIGCFDADHEVAYFHEFRAGVDWVFVDHPSYHRPGNPYGDTHGAFGDNQFRFTLLCHAACEAPLVLPLGGFPYGERCIFVANDWHAGLVPVLLAARYRRFGVYKDARCILAIHNLAHQGVEPATTYSKLGLPGDWYGALEWVFPTWARKHALDKGEAVNHLKGAIVTSDRIVTVSQGYAWEMTTVEGGWGLDGLLRSRNAVINGITNGVDVDEWNPTTDKHIAAQYSLDDFSGKVQLHV